MSQFSDQRDKHYDELTDNMLKELPQFCKQFIRGIENSTSASTRNKYIDDIKNFMTYFLNTNPLLKNKALKDISLEFLDMITPLDIEDYFHDMKYIEKCDKTGRMQTVHRSASWFKRNCSSISSFYTYFYKNGFIKTNPAKLVDSPKIVKKSVIRLEENEQEKLLDNVATGNLLTDRQKKMTDTLDLSIRDNAIISLILGSGIRVSECAGLDVDDIDLQNCSLAVHRKGGKEQIIYFSDDVAEIMNDYIAYRKSQNKNNGNSEDKDLVSDININSDLDTNADENAMFLTRFGKRIGVRGIEILVKKYTQSAVPAKNITVHKLRSTYGTNLYNNTNDLMLVKDVLGHEDIKTTQAYIGRNPEQLKRARNAVKLLSSDNTKTDEKTGK